MKIFYQYSDRKTLTPTKGDFINEISILKSLSRFASVYYSGNLFKPDEPGYGLHDYSGAISEKISEEYDIFYVRANKEVFQRIPANRPKIWMASPYDYSCYVSSNAIATFTKAWENGLKYANQSFVWIPKEYRNIKWDKAVDIGQVVEDNFRPLQNCYKTRKMRKSFGGDFIIGHFGRIVNSNYPYALSSIFNYLEKKYKFIKFVFGTTRGCIPGKYKNILQRKFSYSEIPYALSSCDVVILSNWGPEWEICGSGKVLESAACAIPIILGRSAARVDFLGNDYPYFVNPLRGNNTGMREDADNILDMIKKIINDNNRKKVGENICEKSHCYSIASSAERLKSIFSRYINAHKAD
jgi:glycosyltransferase involved in cell wall biosynthesis